MEQTKTYRAGLYCRLSKDDELRTESTSIGTQRSMMTDYSSTRAQTSISAPIITGIRRSAPRPTSFTMRCFTPMCLNRFGILRRA